MKYSLTQIARQFIFVREIPQNKGQRVEAIQRWGGGVPGDSWCCFFITMMLDICYQGKAPIPRCGACQTVYDMAKKGTNGLRLLADNEPPQREDLFLYVNDEDHAHHVGGVTDSNYLGIAGNTSADGKSDNGDTVAEHPISRDRKRVKFVRLPKS